LRRLGRLGSDLLQRHPSPKQLMHQNLALLLSQIPRRFPASIRAVFSPRLLTPEFPAFVARYIDGIELNPVMPRIKGIMNRRALRPWGISPAQQSPAGSEA
jgi:hypothetical protein